MMKPLTLGGGGQHINLSAIARVVEWKNEKTHGVTICWLAQNDVGATRQEG